jgi:hypothetical protein
MAETRVCTCLAAPLLGIPISYTFQLFLSSLILSLPRHFPSFHVFFLRGPRPATAFTSSSPRHRWFRRWRQHLGLRHDGESWLRTPCLIRPGTKLYALSCSQMFLGNEDSIYILDKAELNPATINGHPAWGSLWYVSFCINRAAACDLWSVSVWSCLHVLN